MGERVHHPNGAAQQRRIGLLLDQGIEGGVLDRVAYGTYDLIIGLYRESAFGTDTLVPWLRNNTAPD